MSRKNTGSGKHCVVFGCTNNSKKLRKWKISVCEIHSPVTHEDCECLQPYQMHRFPNGASNDSAVKRMVWLQNINRKDFSPSVNSRVCSVHFMDGRPTSENPYPVINMGNELLYKNYEPITMKTSAVARPVFISKERSLPMQAETEEDKMEEIMATFKDPSECMSYTQHASVQAEPEMCDAAVQWCDVTVVDHTYCRKEVTADNTLAKSARAERCSHLSPQDLDDNGLTFYTGLGSTVFWAFVNSMLTCLQALPPFKLAVHDQILLVLMRLRLGLMFTDLGIRFGISRTTACDIFAVWLAPMAKYMKDNVIFWLPADRIAKVRPKGFASRHPSATCVVDCIEFIRNPGCLKKSAQTYANYKHQNTQKALYCIAPNGFVMYMSELFSGTASNTFKNCGFCEHLLPGDEVLADKGLSLKDVLPSGVKLSTPAFRKGIRDQMPKEERENNSESKGTENGKIQVERAIRRLKWFKILRTIMPGSVKNVDDILIVCAGLCNLQPCFINEEDSPDEEDVDDEDEPMEMYPSFEEEEID